MKTEALIAWRLFPEPTARFELALPVRIGRHPTSELRFVDEDVSRNHATIEIRDGRISMVDQGSRNGVYLNGRRIGVAPLPPGAVVRLGQTVLWFAPGGTAARLGQRTAEEAQRTAPLLIVGEQGTGRRTLAREIHRKSGRTGALLVVNDLSSETRDGGNPLWRAASGGGVICEAGPDFAARASAAAEHDARLFGIARQPGDSSIAMISVPPVRQRLDEVPDVLRALLTGRAPSSGHLFTPATWNADFFEALVCHPFPLNFGELDALCHTLALAPLPLAIECLPHAVRANVVEARTAIAENLSRELLHDALTRHRGNIRRVAQELGVQRGQLYRLLAGFGLNPDLFRGLVSPGDASPPSSDGRDSGAFGSTGRPKPEERRTLT
jgi:hypothetical protein